MKRREFIKRSAAAGACALTLPSRIWAEPSRNDTLQMALIGAGRMGRGDMNEAMRRGLRPELNARMVAVCDVDVKRTTEGAKAVEDFYREQGENAVEVATFDNVHELLSRDDIDVVVIATPDHWHGLNAIAAANAGKHIYLEKPLSYTIAEGKVLIDAVRRNKVVLQTGSQQRSGKGFRQISQIIRNDWLGPLKTIEVEVPTDTGSASADPMDVPPNLDYDLWLGPTPEVPYTEKRVHPQADFSRPGWLQIEGYCRGMITGWGSHMYDIAQWAMGTDDTGPIEVRAKGEFPDRGLWNVHTEYEGEAHYANGVRVISRNGSPGVRFTTEDGWAYVSRERYDCSDPDLLLREPEGDEIALYQSRNHMENFLSSVRSGEDPVCPVEVGHRSNTICVLHHLSMKLNGRPIKWDPKQQEPVNDPDVAAMMELQWREPLDPLIPVMKTDFSRRTFLHLLAGAAASLPLARISGQDNAGSGDVITRIDLYPARYPMTGYFKFFEGPDGAVGRASVVVKVTTEQGVGWGQSVPVARWSHETLETAVVALRDYFGPALIGHDPADIDGAHRLMDGVIAPGFSTSMPIARAGLDIALWDLRGRREGKPVVELLGGRVGEPLVLSWTLSVKSLDDVEALVAEARERGYENFNIKVAPDPEFDVALAKAARAAAPGGFLWSDANGGYDPETALKAAPRLADAGVDVLEAPLRPNQIRGYQALKEQGALPIFMDEGVISPTELEEFIELAMLDGIACKPSRCGGLTSNQRQIELIEQHQLQWLGSGLTDPDLSLAATLHLYTAFGLKKPAALNGPQFLTASVLKEPLEVVNGRLACPTGPGLGVEVDESKLKRMVRDSGFKPITIRS